MVTGTMFYGKHHASMYEGSMVGKGACVFALMGYVISHQQPDKEYGGVVSLNVKLLAATFGESEESVQSALDVLCKPDADSRTPDKEGRRLIKIGQFEYQVVNYVKYFRIRDEEDKKAANRDRQARHREKLKGVSKAQSDKDKKRRATELDKAMKENFMAEDAKGPKPAPEDVSDAQIAQNLTEPHC